MRYLIVIILLSFPFLAIAQDQLYSAVDNHGKNRNPDYYEKQKTNKYDLDYFPGEQLVKAGNKQILGTTILLGGNLIGSLLISDTRSEGIGVSVFVGSNIAGLVLHYMAWSHIK